MVSTTVRQPPHSIEAEQSVLGGLMLDNRAWHEIADQLSEEDFYTEQHRLIFRGIAQLMQDARPCDFVTLSEALRTEDKLEAAGGIAYLGNLAADTPGAANIRAYAEIVRERSILRTLIATGHDIATLGFEPDGRSHDTLVDIAEQKVFKIRERGERANSGYYEMPPLIATIEDKLDRLRRDPSSFDGVPTGFIEFDKLTTGMHASDLLIIAGRPGMGKTSFAMNIAENVAIEQNLPVLVFSMEMSAEQLATRVLSSYGRIDQQHLRRGELDDTEWSRLASTGGLLRKAPLYIDETGSLSPTELRSRARRITARHHTRLIVVDYIQLMQVPNTRENRTNEVSEISRNLKSLAKELQVPVIAISQLSRGVESRDDKRPRMSDLRESGSIEQDADLVAFVYRDEYYTREQCSEPGVAEIIIAKHRNGPTGKIKTRFLGQYTRFDNVEPIERRDLDPEGRYA
ncbi:MAG TPA: replicative DNA helicase [Nevskiaceae bacterium]|nr:replicative DNA helicase [Nevskiaceae bacterium]